MTMKFLSFGNRWLPDSTAIFNLGSATNCAAEKKGKCNIADICYAKRTEKRWVNTYFYRERQTKVFDGSNPRELADAMLVAMRMQKQRVKMLRFSEAGDFRNQADVDKFARVAKILHENNITVYGYVADDELDYSELMKYATVNGTGFMATNEIRIVDEYSDDPTTIKCPTAEHGKCLRCSACAYAKGRIIEIPKH